MKHLDDHVAFTLAEGGTIEPEWQPHLEQCDRCRQLVAQYLQVLEAAESARALSQEPPTRVQRWARAYARAASAPRRRWLMLPLLAHSWGPVAAVRGGELTGTALLYGDEAHHLDLRIEPSEEGPACLHGQLLDIGDCTPQSWSITAVTASGETLHTTASENGEFWIDGVESWQSATVIAASDSERLVARVLEGEQETAE